MSLVLGSSEVATAKIGIAVVRRVKGENAFRRLEDALRGVAALIDAALETRGAVHGASTMRLETEENTNDVIVESRKQRSRL